MFFSVITHVGFQIKIPVGKGRNHCTFPTIGTLKFKCVNFLWIQNEFSPSQCHCSCLLFSLDFQVYFEGKRAYNTSFRHNHEIVLDKTSRSTEIRVENLKPGTKYSVYVKAKTAKGYGTAGDPVELDTPSKRMLNVMFVRMNMKNCSSACSTLAQGINAMCPHVLYIIGMNFSLLIWMGSASNSLNLRVVKRETSRRREGWADRQTDK